MVTRTARAKSTTKSAVKEKVSTRKPTTRKKSSAVGELASQLAERAEKNKKASELEESDLEIADISDSLDSAVAMEEESTEEEDIESEEEEESTAVEDLPKVTVVDGAFATLYYKDEKGEYQPLETAIHIQPKKGGLSSPSRLKERKKKVAAKNKSTGSFQSISSAIKLVAKQIHN